MDRNSTEPANLTVSTTSLSARRAWIEILESKQIDPSVMVALRKESVDRNKLKIIYRAFRDSSLSARRAWIEIDCRIFVDVVSVRRSPQGERG